MNYAFEDRISALHVEALRAFARDNGLRLLDRRHGDWDTVGKVSSPRPRVVTDGLTVFDHVRTFALPRKRQVSMMLSFPYSSVRELCDRWDEVRHDYPNLACSVRYDCDVWYGGGVTPAVILWDNSVTDSVNVSALLPRALDIAELRTQARKSA